MKLTPKKSLGQNFLLNKNLIKDIVELGNISKESIVIEIGPGTGNLTEEILKKNPKKFFAIEKDKNLYHKLKEKFSKSNIIFINQDVLEINWKNFLHNDLIVFGNLPYNISAKILINWVMQENLNLLFKNFILMFQKEVADRIVANVNSSKYGRLSILTNWKMNPLKIKDINPDNFYPKPKVKSSIVCIEPKKNFFYLNSCKNLEKVTNIFFQNKRKMIKKPINMLFKNPKNVIDKLNLDIRSRPQNLDVPTFLKISKEYEDQ